MKIINYRMFEFSSESKTIAAGNYLYEFKPNDIFERVSPTITRFEGINMPQMIAKTELKFQNAPRIHIQYSALAASQNRYIILSGAMKGSTIEELRGTHEEDYGEEGLEPDNHSFMDKRNLCFLYDTENLKCQKLPNLNGNWHKCLISCATNEQVFVCSVSILSDHICEVQYLDMKQSLG